MPEPVVSVVIPTYNRAELVARAIASVQAQTFPDWECLVVDDASTDDTAEVVGRMGDPRVRYLRRPRNGGPSAARNTGILEARGRYLAFLDSDDLWLPDRLAPHVRLLDAQPEVMVARAGWQWVGPDGVTVRRVRLPDRHGRFDDRPAWAMNNINDVTTRTALARACLYDEALIFYENCDWQLRMERHGPPVWVRSIVASNSDHAEHRASSIQTTEKVRQIRYFMGKHQEALRHDRAARARCHLVLGMMLLRRLGQRQAARAPLWRAIGDRPLRPKTWALLALAYAPHV